MFYSSIFMTSKKTSMILNYLVVFFSLFLFTPTTQGKCIFKEIFKQAKKTSTIIDKTMCQVSFI